MVTLSHHNYPTDCSFTVITYAQRIITSEILLSLLLLPFFDCRKMSALRMCLLAILIIYLTWASAISNIVSIAWAIDYEGIYGGPNGIIMLDKQLECGLVNTALHHYTRV